MGWVEDSWRKRRPRINTLGEIALTAFVLGFVGCLALLMIWTSAVRGDGGSWMYACGVYLFITFTTFHFTEFMIASEYRPQDATPRSFMIFHSTAFLVANAAAWFEFLICGWYLQLGYHPAPSFTSVSVAGFAALVFYGVRALAMVQCGSNFSLMIETSKRREHQLVKHGLYSVLRHPSYFGWFWYSVCTQLITCNPVCFVGFTAATWFFFKARVAEEEELLEGPHFFGAEYTQYKLRSHVGIPFLG